MGRAVRTIGLIVAAVSMGFGIGGQAQAQQSQGARDAARMLQSRPKASPALFELLRRYNAQAAVFGPGKSVTCSTGSDCPVDAEVVELFYADGSLASCVIKTPEILVDIVSGTRTTIIWNLQLPSSPKALYEFEATNGLLIIKDIHGAMTGGTTLSPTQLRKRHRHTGRNREVLYFPIVLQNPASPAPFLCAAGDPKIINN